MPKKPDDRVRKAKELYEEGMKLVEIAKVMGLPEGTVRRWKSTHGWDGERSDKKANVRAKKANVRIKNKGGQPPVDGGIEGSICSPGDNAGISEKQGLFAIYYANSGNATASYQKAYGCSRETAMASGSRMLRNVKVREEVERLKKEKYEAAMFDERDIFQWHLDIATACITDFVTFGREKVQVTGPFGPVKDKATGEPVMKEVNYVKFRGSDDVDGRAIKKVKLGKDGASIELYDAAWSMEWLERNMKSGSDSQQGLAGQIIAAYKKRGGDGSDDRG